MTANRFADFRASCRRDPPRVAVVLGSGLGDVPLPISLLTTLEFADVPGLAAPSVLGHHGQILLGSLGCSRVLLFRGRLHHYEGHPWRSVTLPVAVARELDVPVLLLTNAAGGIRDDLVPGTFMPICRQIDWTLGYPWKSAELPSPYSPRLLRLLAQAAERLEIALPFGTYAQVTGPSYETPAEIRALRSCGADAVGMSTGREIDWAHAAGMECAAVSLITNRAAGLNSATISHDEVISTAATCREKLAALVDAFLQQVIDAA